jgi:hypothetical protein
MATIRGARRLAVLREVLPAILVVAPVLLDLAVGDVVRVAVEVLPTGALVVEALVGALLAEDVSSPDVPGVSFLFQGPYGTTWTVTLRTPRALAGV